ncbi:hypothetical protein GO001_18480 [Streptomyces sp. NRRL B-1677]|uniref:hypothetical protein n=1 Tax=Streptomyces sp. NRRL B-1677 TaxID=2682966 RepID=UPI001E3B7663|nr:hypothetical protein [Streptomyces sp. NRRL B-1677]MBF6047201.1 hypothetical protein [Streptomyces sp. NRRL B-1677]
MASGSRSKPLQPTRPTAPTEPVKPVPHRVPGPEEATGEYTMNWRPPRTGHERVKRTIVRLIPPKSKQPSWKGYTNASLRAAMDEVVAYAKSHTFTEFRDHLLADGVLPECISEDEYNDVLSGSSPDQNLWNPPGPFKFDATTMWSNSAEDVYRAARVPGPKRYSAKQFTAVGLTDLVPAYTEAASQQACKDKLTEQAAEADRKDTAAYDEAMETYRQDKTAYDQDLAAWEKSMDAYRAELADYQQWLRDNDLWVVRGQYEFCEPGDGADALIEPARAPAAGTTRFVDPAPDHVHVGWGRVGGSRTDALDGWRADAQLIADVTPVPGTTDVTITARLRGVAVRRNDAGVWGRTAPYKARAVLNLLARDINGNFGVVSRAKTDDSVDVTGTDPILVGTLTHTVPRNALMDLAIDWLFCADEPYGDAVIVRGMTKGLKVLFLPPSLDGYRPGKVNDPATGNRTGETTVARSTPIQHTVHGHATLTTAPAKTTVSAEVYAELRGMADLLPELGTSVDLDIVSVLERYDTATDRWKSVASGSTRVNKGRLASSVTSGKFSTEVPTGELNLYRYAWRAGDTFQGGSYVEGSLFPIYTTGK